MVLYEVQREALRGPFGLLYCGVVKHRYVRHAIETQRNLRGETNSRTVAYFPGVLRFRFF